MGFKLKRIELCGECQLKPNEERELPVVLEKETRAAIHGTVKFPKCGGPVVGAVVKLFKKANPRDNCHTCDLIPITFTFTDDCGQFLFGVNSKEDYVIKIFFFEPETPCPPPPCDGREHHQPCDC